MIVIRNNDSQRMIFLLLHQLMQVVSRLLLLMLNIQLVLQFLLRLPQNQIVLHLPMVYVVLIHVVVVEQVLDIALR